jgi:hypothetical protein
MAIPASAIAFDQAMDPYDLLDWEIDITQFLEEDERAEEGLWSLVRSAEAIEYGLIISGGDRAAHLSEDGRAVFFWLEVATDQQLDPQFSGAGVLVALELSFTTNSIPGRRRQKTYVVRIAQQ